MKTLTRKQFEIVYLAIEEALPAKLIAHRLRKSIHTVNGILKLVYRSLRINSVVELANWYYRTYYIMTPRNPYSDNGARFGKVIPMVKLRKIA